LNLKIPSELPINASRDIILKAIQENQVVVIAGETGSGKTTQLPKICLEAGCGNKKMIACTQPRRLAAIAMASRVGEEIQVPELVASAVRFHDRTTATTIIRFMTDGLLLAEIRGDRLLSRYDTIILDEAHERSLNIDFLIGCLKQLLGKRPELKLIISSATIDTEKFSRHFADAPIITVSGRMFPVEIRYTDGSKNEENGQENEEQPAMVELACREVFSLCEKPGGDILVFMATERDIMDSMVALHDQLDLKRHLILPLFSRLQGNEQRKIFQPVKKRKIILATNIAETSITVPGIHFVIDSGQARIPVYNVRARTTSLQVRRVSRASCAQRTGRAGRTAPGTCIRLYSEEDYLSRAEFTKPEIQRSNLAEVILQMISLGLGDPRQFPFLDPPTPRAVNEGFRILKELGAITDIKDDRLTGNGKIMAKLPLDPAISRILIEAVSLDCLQEISIISAALSIQDPRMRPANKEQMAKEAQKEFIDPRSDFITLLNIWNRFLKISGGKKTASALGKFSKKHFLSWQRMREWFDIHEQINRQLKSSDLKPLQKQKRQKTAGYEPIHRALCSGFLRNIGYKKKKEKNTYTISGGKEAIIFPGSCLHNRKDGKGNLQQWIVAANFIETTRLFARTVALIDEGWLEELGGNLCKYSHTGCHWSKKIGQVQAMERVTLFGLPIVAGRQVNYGKISPNAKEEAKEIFIQQALAGGELGGSYQFLKHNLELIKEMEEMNDRLRRRNPSVSDYALYEFYKDRVEYSYDRFTLNRLLKRKKSDQFLFMKIEDIGGSESTQDELYRFPKTITVGSVPLELSYVFLPGDEQDGVTVHLPEQQLESISPAMFEWLIPGLLDEKILHLLKKLPKKIRRNLVPIPDAVERIMDRLNTYHGSLYPALEKAVRQEYQLEIKRIDWQVSTLPPHLLMRYQLVDHHGKAIVNSRSFSEIVYLATKKITDSPSGQRKIQKTQKKSSPVINGEVKIKTISSGKTGISRWDFKEIDVSAPISDATGRLLFPALVTGADKTSVDFCYLDNREKARQFTRIGLQTLYCLQFPGCLKKTNSLCKTILTNHSASWLSLGIKCTPIELRNGLIEFIFTDIFECREPLIPDEKTFNQIITNLKKEGIYRKISSLLDLIVKVVYEVRKTNEAINFWQQQCRKNKNTNREMELSFQTGLNAILPADFLFSRSSAEIKEADRYLQALRIRIERAGHDPLKDRKKQTRLDTAVGRLVELNNFESMLTNRQCREVISQYRIMVEEFKVSVFATELGTRMVVSEKRLEKLWQEVENHCRRVEDSIR
jgi:ATP-dependent helicase HrpA